MPWIEQLQSANWSEASFIALGGYLLGCLTTGYYLVRFKTDQDIREVGSGSVGAKNVGRVLGWRGFASTLLGDFCKGALVIWAARHFTKDDRLVVLGMLAVVIGHIWPAQLRFRGGKGMATSLGALLVYDYRLAVAFSISFVGLLAVLRKSVLAGLFSLACLPLVAMYLRDEPAKVIGISILAGLVLLAHRKNLFEEISLFEERRNAHVKSDQTEL